MTTSIVLASRRFLAALVCVTLSLATFTAADLTAAPGGPHGEAAAMPVLVLTPPDEVDPVDPEPGDKADCDDFANCTNYNFKCEQKAPSRQTKCKAGTVIPPPGAGWDPPAGWPNTSDGSTSLGAADGCFCVW